MSQKLLSSYDSSSVPLGVTSHYYLKDVYIILSALMDENKILQDSFFARKKKKKKSPAKVITQIKPVVVRVCCCPCQCGKSPSFLGAWKIHPLILWLSETMKMTTLK